ncbi:MAG: ABC transporter permease, partial [Actinomycetota bacterium]|nr:ABC transporter permease [Actinomycetota bacterium]
MTTLEAPAPAPVTAVDALAAMPEAAASRARSGRSMAVGVARGIGSTTISAVVVIGAWVLFLRLFHVNHFIGKGPLDVWHYLFSGPGATANRTAVLHESFTTLRDAAFGLVAGTVAAV